jgi:O-succinylbenzoate synthase
LFLVKAATSSPSTLWTLSLSPYELQGREAVLVRLNQGERVGYSDLHPWRELGDEPWPVQLNRMREGDLTSQLASTLERCLLDEGYRTRGASPFAGLQVPPSHILIDPQTDLAVRSDARAERETFKLKLGRDGTDDLDWLEGLHARHPQHRFRLDFNGRMSAQRWSDFWLALSPAVRASIDFVEDPCPWDAAVWSRLRETTGARLALDRAPTREFLRSGFDVAVVKPAVCRWAEWLTVLRATSCDIVVTSYLEHAIGRAQAAFRAAEARILFADRVLIGGVRFDASPDAAGFGYTRELNEREWTVWDDRLDLARFGLEN